MGKLIHARVRDCANTIQGGAYEKFAGEACEAKEIAKRFAMPCLVSF